MKNKDTVALSEAYELVQESKFKSALAAAALGLGSLHGHDVDTVNPHSPEDTIYPKTNQNIQQEPTETNYHKAMVAYEKARKEKIVNDVTLNQIALDQDISKRYALFLISHGKRIPEIIKRATGKYSADLESAFNSDIKN